MTDWVEVEPLTDDALPRRYWPDFHVGDRVRVRLSGECRITGPGVRIENPRVITDGVGHPEWADGREGVVRPCPNGRCAGFYGHDIVVYQTAPNGHAWAGHYAASELEPLP